MHHSAQGSWQWTCPAGKRAILKWIGSTTSGEDYSLCGYQLAIAGMFAAGFFFQAPILGHGEDLYAVVYGGETVTLHMYGTSIHTHVAGWLLDDVQGAQVGELPGEPCPPLIPFPPPPAAA